MLDAFTSCDIYQMTEQHHRSLRNLSEVPVSSLLQRRHMYCCCSCFILVRLLTLISVLPNYAYPATHTANITKDAITSRSFIVRIIPRYHIRNAPWTPRQYYFFHFSQDFMHNLFWSTARTTHRARGTMFSSVNLPTYFATCYLSLEELLALHYATVVLGLTSSTFFVAFDVVELTIPSRET